MARQFNDLVKDFNNIRLYAQDFYINGYKQREEFHSKSPRSYDNERRRIESYLTEFIEWEQSGQGKSLRLELQQEQLDTNPFFRLWQTKSFTKNDIFLHFTLLDCLSHGPQSLPQLTALIHNDYLSQFVEQVSLTDMTIRHKVKEYCQLGIIEEFEQEKRVVFQLKPRFELSEDMIDVLHFFKEMAPGGVIGQFLLNQQPATASPFVFKHHFIVHSLDEQIVLTILEAIDQKNRLRLAQGEKEFTLVPMAVYISTESGRHYLVGQSMGPNSLRSIRIDTIKEASLAGHISDYDAYYQAFLTKKNQTWNGSFNQQRLKQLTVLLRIKEGEEDYLMLRLEREQRMGHSQRIDRETVKFEIELTDLFAINPFLRTFIGRIIAIESTDSHWRASFIRDLDQLISLYSTDDQKESLNHDH